MTTPRSEVEVILMELEPWKFKAWHVLCVVSKLYTNLHLTPKATKNKHQLKPNLCLFFKKKLFIIKLTVYYDCIKNPQNVPILTDIPVKIYRLNPKFKWFTWRHSMILNLNQCIWYLKEKQFFFYKSEQIIFFDQIQFLLLFEFHTITFTSQLRYYVSNSDIANQNHLLRYNTKEIADDLFYCKLYCVSHKSSINIVLMCHWQVTMHD